MTIKEGLRLVIERTRERENAELVLRCDDAPPAEPGRWTVKDTLAHLTAWRQHAVAVLEAARTGSTLPPPDNVDATNAKIYASIKGLPAAEVKRSAAASWDSLMQFLDHADDSVLRSPRPHRPDDQTWEVIPPNTHHHLAEHLGYLAMERSDPAAAEAAARWGHDLDASAFPDPKSRAHADYNLGCFYSRQGRVPEAAPLFAQAFELKPALREWAQKDKDLDPIRQSPEILRLLG